MLFSNRFIYSQVIFCVSILILFICFKNINTLSHLPKLNTIQDFSLTNHHQTQITLTDLKNHIWVADFVFTTCSGVCPMMSQHMSAISKAFQDHNDVKMVSISVNPENDTPEVLTTYAKKYNANDRWLFLTGNREDIQKLAVDSFKMGDMKEIVFHSSHFVLVDRRGRIRGYYNSEDSVRMGELVSDLKSLRKEIDLPFMPSLNAFLNGLAGVFLLFGFIAIKRRDPKTHRKFMIAALCSSALFLVGYLYYHFTSHFLTKYQGEGMLRNLYFFVLGTHTPLAALIVPFIIIAVRHAIKGDFVKHKRITRWLYPTWTYVSVTGVIVYLMLYVFRPA